MQHQAAWKGPPVHPGTDAAFPGVVPIRRANKGWSELAAGIDKPHEQRGKGARETVSKQKLNAVSGKALLPLLRPAVAAEFGTAVHPEQGLWLSSPFPSWLGESPFPLTVMNPGSQDCHGSRQSLLRFPQMATSQGAQGGKAIKFSMQAGSTISGADWCAQCVSQAWPLERFQEGGGTYFIHQSSDFCIGTTRIAAVDLQALRPVGSLWLSPLPACVREPITFPW